MKIRMPPLHPAQLEIHKAGARFKVLSCGRRFGKTLFAASEAFACAAQGGRAWWVGPTGREALIGWRLLMHLAKQVPGTRPYASTRKITFPSRGWLQVLSAQSHTLRGEGLDLVCIDEAAFLRDLVNTWNAELRPTLTDRMGRAILFSTPDGRGDFYKLYMRGQDPEQPDWASWQLPTSMNPYIPASEIGAAQRDMPEWLFRQEYMAEFVIFAGKVYKTFTPESECVFDIETRTPKDTDEHWGGIDFGFRNPTAISIGALDSDDRLDIIDGVYERGLLLEDLTQILLDLQDRHDVRMFFADKSEPGTIQSLALAGVRVTAAPSIRGDRVSSEIRQGCAEVETRFVSGRLRIARHLENHVDETDGYRYKDESDRQSGDEAPLKVKDHAPDSIRYLVTGVARHSAPLEVYVL